MVAIMHEGFSIFGIFENNLLNWLVLVGLIVWMWSSKMPAVFASRKDGIDAALKEAAAARAEGEAFLAEQQKKIAEAEKEASRIIDEAKQVAIEMKKEIEESTRKDLADLSVRIEHEIAQERQLAITELRAAAAKIAIDLTRETLPKAINSGTKGKLLNDFVDQIESMGGSRPKVLAEK